jgi:hypothetical protein
MDVQILFPRLGTLPRSGTAVTRSWPGFCRGEASALYTSGCPCSPRELLTIPGERLAWLGEGEVLCVA